MKLSAAHKNGSLQIAVLLIFLMPILNFAQTSYNNSGLFSPVNRLKFGNYLFADKDYLRASAEFKEYLKSFDDDTVRFNYSLCLFNIGKYEEASDNFKTLFYGNPFTEKARLYFYESYFFGKDYKELRDLADNQNYKSVLYSKGIERLKNISYLMDDSRLPEMNSFLSVFDDSVQSRIAKFYYQKKNPKHKNPVTAAIFSAIIPGSGKIYTGEIGDGITAFITTALSAYLAYSNFKADHNFRGWLFTGLTAFFYSGNVYGSAASAQIYNARIRFNFDKEVKIYFGERNYFLPKSDY
ncbi:MAG: hypothetical protein M1391_11935 [Bacteroidetes bacterium]|nr:hypothetical protein [Bacteroidota bacterium]